MEDAPAALSPVSAWVQSSCRSAALCDFFRVSAAAEPRTAPLVGGGHPALASPLNLFSVVCPHDVLCLDPLTTGSCEVTVLQAAASLSESELSKHLLCPLRLGCITVVGTKSLVLNFNQSFFYFFTRAKPSLSLFFWMGASSTVAV